MLKTLTKKILQGQNLTSQEVIQVLDIFIKKEATPEQTAFFLGALSCKGETAEEIAAFASFMKNCSTQIPIDIEKAIDICGTGGDGAKTFNISTAASFVAAGAGAIIAKHGGRSVSSKSGSADVLEELGLSINMDAKSAINKIGMGFIFAPTYNPVMKILKDLRVSINMPTVLNLLGPLTNPAGVKRQLIGVYDLQKALKLIEALKILGTEEAMTVHSKDGLDEISISAPTTIYHLKNDQIKEYNINPTDYGINFSPIESIQGGNSQENAAIIIDILNGKKSPARDIVVLNAAAALVVSNIANDFKEGILLAQESIDKKNALAKLEALQKCF